MTQRVIHALVIVLAGILLHPNRAYSVRHEAALQRRGGVYVVDVQINGAATYPFVVDSGASEVMLTADVLLALRRQGAIDFDADILESQTYVDASGDSEERMRVRLRTLRIGPVTVRNVEAGVNSVESQSLLLGQSFLSRVDWRLDANRGLLELSDESTNPRSIPDPPAMVSPPSANENTEGPEASVRRYFEHLRSHRVSEAAQAWVRMDPERLGSLVGSQAIELSAATLTAKSADSASVWVEFVAIQENGARHRHCGPVILVRTDGSWKISTTREVRQRAAGESCSSPAQPLRAEPSVPTGSPATDCGDWRLARFPDCPVAALRTYWGRVLNHETKPAIAQWVHVNPAWLSRVIGDTESVGLQDLTVISQSSSRARVRVIVTTKSKGRASSLWCGIGTLLWIEGEWKIWSLPLKETGDLSGCSHG